jgi:flagellar biosynthesis protein FlhG
MEGRLEMLDEDVHVKDCLLLGIDADSRLVEVERAWRSLKAIYAEGSLATYGLIEDAGRQEKLEELEGAYGRIARRFSRPATEQPVSPTGNREKCASQVSPTESAGRFLRQLREGAGLSLKDVAHRTKISPMRLDQIEQEMFERLPAAVYLRGFVLEYAKALGFPQPQEVAGLYLSRYQERVRNP